MLGAILLRKEVDPRACGVDLGWEQDKLWTLGGSPRMRGRHLHKRLETHYKGWIPAHAG